MNSWITDKYHLIFFVLSSRFCLVSIALNQPLCLDFSFKWNYWSDQWIYKMKSEILFSFWEENEHERRWRERKGWNGSRNLSEITFIRICIHIHIHDVRFSIFFGFPHFTPKIRIQPPTHAEDYYYLLLLGMAWALKCQLQIIFKFDKRFMKQPRMHCSGMKCFHVRKQNDQLTTTYSVHWNYHFQPNEALNFYSSYSNNVLWFS